MSLPGDILCTSDDPRPRVCGSGKALATKLVIIFCAFVAFKLTAISGERGSTSQEDAGHRVYCDYDGRFYVSTANFKSRSVDHLFFDA